MSPQMSEQGNAASSGCPALPVWRIENQTIRIWTDDIVRLRASAIVCSRDRSLQARTASPRSVHGAIQRFGGPDIDAAAARLGPIPHGGICVTHAGKLPSKHVVHAGIIDDLARAPTTSAILAKAVAAALAECQRHRWSVLGLPLMGTRAGGLSQEQAVEAMLLTVVGHLKGASSPSAVYFCLPPGSPALAYLLRRMPELIGEPLDRAPPPIRKVFICCKSEDYPQAAELVRYLMAKNIPVFFSQESLPNIGDADYRRAIDRALDEAEHMVVVTSSRENVQSPWVEAEWGFFINEKRSGRKRGNLITLALANLKPQDLPPSLRYYEVVPAGPNAFDRILRYVGG